MRITHSTPPYYTATQTPHHHQRDHRAPPMCVLGIITHQHILLTCKVQHFMSLSQNCFNMNLMWDLFTNVKHKQNFIGLFAKTKHDVFSFHITMLLIGLDDRVGGH